MSADNWGTCPKCLATGKANWDAAMRDAVNCYGKVSPDEYEAAMTIARKPLDVPVSLREDYEIGVNKEGLFCINYRCSCQNCDFHHSFELEKKVYP